MITHPGHDHIYITFAKDVGHGYAMTAKCECGRDYRAMGSTEQAALKSIRLKHYKHITERIGRW